MRCLAAVVAALLLSNAAWAQAQYDLLLKGGHVIDPRNDINRRMDVAVTAGKIARVAENIAASEAKKVVDVTGSTSRLASWTFTSTSTPVPTRSPSTPATAASPRITLRFAAA